MAQQSLKGTALPRGLCHSLALSLATVLCSWPANQPTHLQLLNSLSGYTRNTFLDFHQPFLAPRIWLSSSSPPSLEDTCSFCNTGSRGADSSGLWATLPGPITPVLRQRPLTRNICWAPTPSLYIGLSGFLWWIQFLEHFSSQWKFELWDRNIYIYVCVCVCVCIYIYFWQDRCRKQTYGY